MRRARRHHRPHHYRSRPWGGDYASIDGLKRLLDGYEVTIQNEEYAGAVTLRVGVLETRRG